MMEHEKTFKTKTGYCHVLPDRIVLSRDGIIGNVVKVTVGNEISSTLIIYGALSIGLFYIAFQRFQRGERADPLFFGLVGLYLIYGILSSMNNFATPIIEREKIKEVKFKRSIAGLTRSRFEVFFEDKQGKRKKRLIMLPGSLTNGENETEKALQIMLDEHLITKRD